MIKEKHTNYQKLTKEIDRIFKILSNHKLIENNSIVDVKILEEINKSDFLISIHDVQYYIPICINNQMKLFYDFEQNWLKEINHAYYLKTIHSSTYHALIQSISFFKKNAFEYLNLEYKLLHQKTEWKEIIGSSKVLIKKHDGSPKYSITVACNKNKSQKINLIHLLTDREKEITGYLIKGLSNKEISIHVFISENTVHTHKKNIYKKLGVKNISQLIYITKNYLI